MGDLSEEKFLRQRATQTESLENLQRAIPSSSATDNLTTRLLKTVLEFCNAIKAKLNLQRNTGIDVNGSDRTAARRRIAAVFAAMKDQTDRMFSCMQQDAEEATESLTAQEQGAVTNFMENVARIWEVLCEFVRLFFKLLSKGITWIYNKLKESFLEFVEHLEAIVGSNQNGNGRIST